MQGGEDIFFTKERLGEIIRHIKNRHPDCAVTLSFGEWEKEAYQYWKECGADRYLLRHETASEVHYALLHPDEMSFVRRRQCLQWLKEAGYQTGAGFMTGSPGQTTDTLLADLRYLEQLKDPEQTAALACILQYLELHVMDGRKTMQELAEAMEKQLDEKGLESLFDKGQVKSSLARPRRQEIEACVKRYRKLFFSDDLLGK